MAEADGTCRVTVAFSPAARQVHQWALQVTVGTTVFDALGQSGLFGQFPALREQPLALAIWGRTATGSQAVREGDRIEVLRALSVDPKVARRERFARQGARGTGLFAKKKPGHP
jgi:putative ubiquitin-RnfH superfamily antitoxin RatB of RatAB toxin-antitoxin module